MKKIFILGFGLLSTIVLFSQATDLFISEYVEGSSYRKALEIFNGTGASVDLSQYSIMKQTNGSGEFGSELVLEGTLANEDVYVIVKDNNGTDDLTEYEFVDLASGSQAMNFNGNDAIALCYNGSPIDIVGVVDSSDDWGKNLTFVRKSTIFSPTVTYDVNEWDEYPQDTIEYLGYHEFDGGSNDPTIYVLSPNGGEQWEQGTTHTINWNSLNFDGNVRISLEMVDGRDRDILIDETENDGEWDWVIPTDQAIDDWYVIIVEGVVPGDPWDQSDNVFSIIEPIVPLELSIYDIQYSDDGPSPYANEFVQTTGVVSAVFYNSFFIQDGEGAWNGLNVYPFSEEVALGDEIVIRGTIEEYNDKTELTDYEIISNNGITTIPAPVDILTGDLASEEMYEGVLVRVNEITVTNPDMGYGEWEIDDFIDSSGPCVVDDLGEYTYFPVQDDMIYSLVGVVDYSFGAYKLEPRDDADFNFGGVVVSPTTLEFYTYNDIEGLSFSITNNSTETVTISNIEQSGNFEIAVWAISPWEIELPYELMAQDEIEFTVIVGLPVTFDRDIETDMLDIETSAGNFEITLLFDSELVNDADESIIPIEVSTFNYPNPFNPETTIAFSLSQTDNVQLAIYNCKGQHVKTLLQTQKLAGDHSIVWDGKNSTEEVVNSGVYFYQLKTEDKTITKKIILMK